MAPIVGIATQYEAQTGSYLLREGYASWLADAGAACTVVLPAPDEAALFRVLGRLDGIVLPGGDDIDPALYGQDPLPGTDAPIPRRDALETSILQYADATGMPVLGICRGAQMLNVFYGGTLCQSLAACMPGALDHWAEPGSRPCHRVRIAADQPLAKLFGAEEIQVNSLHRQAVGTLADPLSPMAFADDGVIEALRHAAKPFVWGVQWHPEYRASEPYDSRLAQAFAAACAAYAERRGR